ncbi:uncharacterized protein LOC105915052 [Setaria italica]|uniref:uncharacterized protein LOC105915052 n=1 Tax=Setaria italica TaxID=4555 RepID=UPI0006461A67|nr:uncharacterized protein LOC105915052 [Setaria italica]
MPPTGTVEAVALARRGRRKMSSPRAAGSRVGEKRWAVGTAGSELRGAPPVLHGAAGKQRRWPFDWALGRNEKCLLSPRSSKISTGLDQSTVISGSDTFDRASISMYMYHPFSNTILFL